MPCLLGSKHWFASTREQEGEGIGDSEEIVLCVLILKACCACFSGSQWG